MTARERNSVRLFAGVDRVAVILYVVLTLVGFASIFSASWNETSDSPLSLSHNYMKQAMWLGISWVAALVILLLDSSVWHKFSYFIYGFGILALLSTLAIGTTVNGAKAWISLGGFRIQPMEFAKIAIALATARMMSEYSFSLDKPKDLLRLGALLLLPLGIAVLQNDLGSGLVLGSFLFMLYREGLNNWLCVPVLFIAMLFILSFVFTPVTLLVALIVVFTLSAVMMMRESWQLAIKYVATLFAVSIMLHLLLNLVVESGTSYYVSLLTTTILSLVAVIVYAFRKSLRALYIIVLLFFVSIMILPTSDLMFNKVLKEHQQKRIQSFLGLVSDPRADYNVNQSKIAIGSGGVFGKGYLQGSQIRYGFVPERHTDFIFCTIGEEFGFVGSLALLLLLAAFILRLMRMGDRQQETFGRVYCYCIASILLFHVLINIGMTIGLMPVMGIPLPFISYGGSSLFAFTIMVFIAFSLDASTRRELPTYRYI
ncbi:MAG: rod shape-determining protein RodA [Alistipes sp.]|jgi:rod shape determining protein RodA|nr:rod shape-determining protein RodA [Alistipes sp.]